MAEESCSKKVGGGAGVPIPLQGIQPLREQQVQEEAEPAWLELGTDPTIHMGAGERRPERPGQLVPRATTHCPLMQSHASSHLGDPRLT